VRGGIAVTAGSIQPMTKPYGGLLPPLCHYLTVVHTAFLTLLSYLLIAIVVKPFEPLPSFDLIELSEVTQKEATK
jgi:hypothetical protein